MKLHPTIVASLIGAIATITTGVISYYAGTQENFADVKKEEKPLDRPEFFVNQSETSYDVATQSFKIKIGEKLPFDSAFSESSVTLENIKSVNNSEFAADMNFDLGGAIMNSGSQVEELGVNRFRLRKTRISADEKFGVMSFWITEDSFNFIGLTVKHINPHSGEVNVLIALVQKKQQ